MEGLSGKEKLDAQIKEAVQCLKRGEIVAYPTETVFGLAVLPGKHDSVERLLDLKDRSLNAGVPLIISDPGVMEDWIEASSAKVSEAIREITGKFWPGALTLVIELNQKGREIIDPGILGPGGSLAVRVSSCPEAQALAEAAGGAITSTSANPKGMPAPKSAAQAAAYFPSIFILSSAESCSLSENVLPSTIVDVRRWPFRLLRAGAIGKEVLKSWL